jgi:4-amino-4-deoxy-L-arabinose transferase-like glycosyltransferase
VEAIAPPTFAAGARALPARASATVRDHAGWLVLILTLALLARLLWVAFSQWQPTPDDDAFRYDFTARALAAGRGYIHLNGEPTAFWPPGYSLLLAGAYQLFGPSLAVAQLMNALIGTATVGLVYLIGRRVLGPQHALVGAAVVAAFPSLIFFTAVTLSETAFTLFALLGIYLLLLEARAGHRLDLRLLLPAGLALGFASLVRGQALLLPLVAIPFWLRSGVPWPGAGEKLVALALGIGLIVAPWSIRNAVQLDAPVVIATNAGVDFWIGHHESARGDFGDTGGDPLVYSHPELSTVEREVRINTEGFRKGLSFALTHPQEELALPFQKLFWLYYSDEEALKWNEGHGGQAFLNDGVREALLGLSNVYYFSVLALFLLGTPLWLTGRDPGRLLLISLFAYWTLMHVVFFGDPRFHAPIVPVIALLASLPIVAIWAGRAPWQRPEAEEGALRLDEGSAIVRSTMIASPESVPGQGAPEA